MQFLVAFLHSLLTLRAQVYLLYSVLLSVYFPGFKKSYNYKTFPTSFCAARFRLATLLREWLPATQK